MTHPTQDNQDAERAAFEAAYQSEFPISVSLSMEKFARDDCGDYKENCVYTAHRMWLAARRASTPAEVGAGLPPLAEPSIRLGWGDFWKEDQVRQAQRDAVEADRRARDTIAIGSRTYTGEEIKGRILQQEADLKQQDELIEKAGAEIADLRAALSRQIATATEASGESVSQQSALLDLLKITIGLLSVHDCEAASEAREQYRKLEAELAAGAARHGGETIKGSTESATTVGVEPVYQAQYSEKHPHAWVDCTKAQFDLYNEHGEDKIPTRTLYAAPAHTAAPIAGEQNQCSGCRAMHPEVNGMHHDAQGRPYMVCQRSRYASASAHPVERAEVPDGREE